MIADILYPRRVSSWGKVTRREDSQIPTIKFTQMLDSLSDIGESYLLDDINFQIIYLLCDGKYQSGEMSMWCYTQSRDTYRKHLEYHSTIK